MWDLLRTVIVSTLLMFGMLKFDFYHSSTSSTIQIDAAIEEPNHQESIGKATMAIENHNIKHVA